MIDRVDLGGDIQRFHSEYVAARKPCILTSLEGDLADLSKYANLAALTKFAGNVKVAVEPISEKGTFGTAATKQEMHFKDFLRKLQNGEKVYLTTQYSEEQDDAIFTEPLSTLKRTLHLPTIPNLARQLLPAKINIWLGASVEGTSSGLHHDFHDNFYILLSGQKKFRIFPPSWRMCKKLKIYGRPHEIYSNGLISYNPSLCADGLTQVARAQISVDIAEHMLEDAREDGHDVERAEAILEYATDALLTAKLADADEIEDGDFEGMDDDEDETGSSEDGDGSANQGGSGELDDEDIEILKTLPELSSAADSRDDSDTSSEVALDVSSDEPPSFSKLTTSEVASLLLEEENQGNEFTLRAGELLYLPASYFHEVISTSAGDDYHMAINYWFYPPDAPDGGYNDEALMSELRARIEKQDRPSRSVDLMTKKKRLQTWLANKSKALSL